MDLDEKKQPLEDIEDEKKSSEAMEVSSEAMAAAVRAEEPDPGTSFSIPDGHPYELDTTEFPHSVEIKRDKMTVKYTGAGNHKNDFGSVRTSLPLPRDVNTYYFEITVVSGGRKGAISIGLSLKSFDLSRQVGSERDSCGYCGDDGKKYLDSKAEFYGQCFNTGDVVGCGYNFHTHSVFFTKNGKNLGKAFEGMRGVFYPTISLHSLGELVRVNLGTSAFMFDIEAYRKSEMKSLASRIQRTPVDRACISPLIREFLAHSGYAHTLRAFDEVCGDAISVEAANGGLVRSFTLANGKLRGDRKSTSSNGSLRLMEGEEGEEEEEGRNGEEDTKEHSRARRRRGDRGGRLRAGASSSSSRNGNAKRVQPGYSLSIRSKKRSIKKARGGVGGGGSEDSSGVPNGDEPELQSSKLDAKGGGEEEGQREKTEELRSASDEDQEITRLKRHMDICVESGHEDSNQSCNTDIRIEERQKVRVLLVEGKIREASLFLEKTFPQVLKQKHIRFSLDCQEFVELLRRGCGDKALAFARSRLAAYRDLREHQKDRLFAVMGMLAFEDVQKSSSAGMLGKHHREALAVEVNAEIMACLGLPPTSRLERILSQLKAVQETLRDANGRATPRSYPC